MHTFPFLSFKVLKWIFVGTKSQKWCLLAKSRGHEIQKVQKVRFKLGVGPPDLTQKVPFHAGNTLVGLLGPMKQQFLGCFPN